MRRQSVPSTFGCALPNLLLALISLAVSILLIEAALRLFGMANPVLYQKSEEFGYERYRISLPIASA
jgi:hypothetical protein